MQVRSYRFKLFNNSRKSRRLEGELRVFCEIYNHSIRLIKTHYKIFGKNPSKNNLQKHLAKIGKTEFPYWEALGYSQGIQDVTDRIYKSYDAFFKWAKNKKSGKAGKGCARKSPPKIRPFRKYKSFTLKKACWKIDEEKGRVKIGPNWYRYNNSRKIQGTPKTINIKRDAVGDWFITISCELDSEYRPEKIAPVTGKSAGFDFGLKTFLVSNENDKFQSGEFLKHSLKELAKASRSLARKEKGSKNRKKSRKQLARVHRKVSRKRADAHFKLAIELLRKYDYIFIEDLNINAMKKIWGRKVSDLGFSSFVKILEFKTLEHRKTLHKIDRFYPSTKLCSGCGMIKTSDEIKLDNRVYKCECCGLEIDRDLNAAINIYNVGASTFGLDGVSSEFVPASVV